MAVRRLRRFRLAGRPVSRERSAEHDSDRRVRGEVRVTAAALSLPLALRDGEAFFQSVAATPFHTTFRNDSLSCLSWLADAGVSVPILLRLVGITFLASFSTVAISLVRFRRTPAAFVAASMATYLLFFAFNKQSLAHDSMVVFASGAGLIAALDLPQDAESGSAQPSD